MKKEITKIEYAGIVSNIVHYTIKPTLSNNDIRLLNILTNSVVYVSNIKETISMDNIITYNNMSFLKTYCEHSEDLQKQYLTKLLNIETIF